MRTPRVFCVLLASLAFGGLMSPTASNAKIGSKIDASADAALERFARQVQVKGLEDQEVAIGERSP